MDPDVAEALRRAHEHSIMLVTLLLSKEDSAATELAYNEEAYYEAATCMSLAMVAAAAIRTLGEQIGVDPMEIVQVAGLSAAQTVVNYETGES